MKKNTMIAIGSTIAAGAAAALGFVLYKKKKQNQIQEPETDLTQDLTQDLTEEISESSDEPKVKQIFVDYKDEDHLIFCEESCLDKRIIQLENTINMRDIGGYTGLDGRKTKWGKVIRSEELNVITDNDVTYLESIGLKHIFDFRDEKKAIRTPDRVPNGTEYHNMPALTGLPIAPPSAEAMQNLNVPDPIGEFFKAVYGYQVKERAQTFADVLKILAKDETPILFHCSNGKDRTGFMAALILLICGVPEETILSDYTLTNLTFDTACRRFTPHMVEEFGCDPDRIRDFFGVRPEWLKIQLDYIKNNYANVDAYFLDKTDLTQEDLDAVRAVMLA